MDVLKEIARAEKHAAEIENEYSEKAKSIASSVALKIEDARTGLESALKAETETLRARREKRVEEEKKAIAAGSAEENKSLQKRARDGESKAVGVLLKKLGL